MSDDDPIIGGRLLSSLKVTELREELEKLGLSTKGVKAVLQDRLKEYLIKNKTPQKENPLVLEYRAKQQIALAVARAADPRNKKPSTSEDQVTSTKPAESPKKNETDGSNDSIEPNEQENVQEAVEPEKAESSPNSTSSTSSSSTSTRSTPSAQSSPSASLQNDKKTIAQESKSEVVAIEKQEDKEQEKNEAQENGEENHEKELQKASHEDEEKKEETDVNPVAKVEIEANNENDDQPKKTVEAETSPVEEKTKVASEEVAKKEEEKEKGLDANNDDVDELDYGDEDEKDGKDEQMESNDVETVKKSPEAKKKNDRSVEKEEKMRGETENRPRASSPSSRHPVSNIIHIRGLVRPFTERGLREEVSKSGGEIVDLWMDKVKSHCFIKLTSNEFAEKVIKTLHGTHWPESNPKQLSIVYESEEMMKRYKDGNGDIKLPEVITIGTLTGKRSERLSSSASASASGILNRASLKLTVENVVRDNSKRDGELKEKRGSLASRLTRIDDKPKDEKAQVETKETERKRQRSETPPFSRGAGFLDEKRGRLENRLKSKDDHREVIVPEEPILKTPDQLFKKTTTLPAIYFLPLTDEQIEIKLAKREARRRERE